MYNKYYKLNESRWELPEENDIFKFKYPNYGYDINDIKNAKYYNKNGINCLDDIFKIKNNLESFYSAFKYFIVTEYDKLENNECYSYIDFSYFTPEELNEIDLKGKKRPGDEDKTYLVREVIRKYPKLNPSDILFKKLSLVCQLSEILSCVIKIYNFQYHIYNNSLNILLKTIYYNGIIMI